MFGTVPLVRATKDGSRGGEPMTTRFCIAGVLVVVGKLQLLMQSESVTETRPVVGTGVRHSTEIILPLSFRDDDEGTRL